MALPVGIDLGTTNSAISIYRRGRVETLRVEGSTSMPSAVCFRDPSTTLVGNKALNMALIRPESTVLSVKRKMGDRKMSYSFNGKSYSPVDISSMILRKLCEGHEEILGGPPRDAVITVPAYFTDDQRKDTKLAGEAAGLNVLRLLPEPTAAAIAIGLDKGRDQTILVYDLGGGTFDVSILQVQNNNFVVRAVNGNHDLGGNDFDIALRNYALDQFVKEKNIDLRKEDPHNPDVRQAMQVLTSSCERIKMELSDAEQAFFDLPNFYRGLHLESGIDRKTFEGLIHGLVYDTKELVLRTIREAGLNVDDIDRLVLVGGSTKVPMVARVLAETVKEPYVADNVDLAVSHGAAIMAASLAAVQETAARGPAKAANQGACEPVRINVTDVVAHPISALMEGEGGVECSQLIAKNTALPATGMTLGAMRPLQVVGELPIFRGGDKRPENNQYLGKLTMTITPAVSFTFIRFELLLDENGVLQVEGSILDLEGRDPRELQWVDPKTLRVKKKIRAEIKIPD